MKKVKNIFGWNTPKHFIKFMKITKHLEYGFIEWSLVLKKYRKYQIKAYLLLLVEKLVEILNKNVVIKLEDS